MLNMGDGTFCDVSAVSGFDLPDDGRGLGLVDWDHDGDLDVWLTNRNGPQLRFLRNRLDSSQRFIALRLIGTRDNRDAVGATVTLIPDEDSRPIVRTVTAGCGFLSQNSKWLHFGLGSATRIERVVVRWPDGSREQLSGPAVGGHYSLKQGQGDWVSVKFSRPQPTPASPTKKPITSDHGNSTTFCFSMTHFPATDYTSLDGQRQTFQSGSARLTLVNLWAPWCEPCIAELSALAQNENLLRRHGFDVVALVVPDSQMTGVSSGGDAAAPLARDVLSKLGYPFRAGLADDTLLDKLQLWHDTVFELRSPLPLPTSFLIDRQGRVMVIFKGTVTVEQLVDVRKRLARAKTTEQWRACATPFPGRWQMPARQRHLFDFVRQLADRGYYTDCQRYVEKNPKMMVTHPGWPALKLKIAAGQ